MSPRAEIPLAVDFIISANAVGGGKTPFPNGTHFNSSALIVGDWKLLEGLQLLTYYQGPEFPNASSAPYGSFADKSLLHFCIPACLYNIKTDPTEQHNVALTHPVKVVEMSRRLAELRKTRFEMESKTDYEGCGTQVKRNGNFFGPWAGGASHLRGMAPKSVCMHLPAPPLSVHVCMYVLFVCL